ncbi:unnamed protein product [Symbiodinium natans]|uniref:Uncharacterized protein n=1 Tax=Symbiodinium natans TaxID=878477 RepID=A0A812UJN7_9DINO|nr:unnamed protein product [Symbiodinium natans]
MLFFKRAQAESSWANHAIGPFTRLQEKAGLLETRQRSEDERLQEAAEALEIGLRAMELAEEIARNIWRDLSGEGSACPVSTSPSTARDEPHVHSPSGPLALTRDDEEQRPMPSQWLRDAYAEIHQVAASVAHAATSATTLGEASPAPAVVEGVLHVRPAAAQALNFEHWFPAGDAAKAHETHVMGEHDPHKPTQKKSSRCCKSALTEQFESQLVTSRGHARAIYQRYLGLQLRVESRMLCRVESRSNSASGLLALHPGRAPWRRGAALRGADGLAAQHHPELRAPKALSMRSAGKKRKQKWVGAVSAVHRVIRSACMPLQGDTNAGPVRVFSSPTGSFALLVNASDGRCQGVTWPLCVEHQLLGKQGQQRHVRLSTKSADIECSDDEPVREVRGIAEDEVQAATCALLYPNKVVTASMMRGCSRKEPLWEGCCYRAGNGCWTSTKREKVFLSI